MEPEAEQFSLIRSSLLHYSFLRSSSLRSSVTPPILLQALLSLRTSYDTHVTLAGTLILPTFHNWFRPCSEREAQCQPLAWTSQPSASQILFSFDGASTPGSFCGRPLPAPFPWDILLQKMVKCYWQQSTHTIFFINTWTQQYPLFWCWKAWTHLRYLKFSLQNSTKKITQLAEDLVPGKSTTSASMWLSWGLTSF